MVASAVFAGQSRADNFSAGVPSADGYYLTYPCCNGDLTPGVRNNINIPADGTITSHCLAVQSLARDTTVNPSVSFSTGAYHCKPGYAAAACIAYVNWSSFVEQYDSGGSHCLVQGTVSTGSAHKYTVRENQSGNPFCAFIDGATTGVCSQLNTISPDIHSRGAYTGGTSDSFQAASASPARWRGGTS
jgi:hypothetical protein